MFFIHISCLAAQEADSDVVKPSPFSLLQVCEWIDCLFIASSDSSIYYKVYACDSNIN